MRHGRCAQHASATMRSVSKRATSMPASRRRNSPRPRISSFGSSTPINTLAPTITRNNRADERWPVFSVSAGRFRPPSGLPLSRGKRTLKSSKLGTAAAWLPAAAPYY